MNQRDLDIAMIKAEDKLRRILERFDQRWNNATNQTNNPAGQRNDAQDPPDVSAGNVRPTVQ